MTFQCFKLILSNHCVCLLNSAPVQQVLLPHPIPFLPRILDLASSDVFIERVLFSGFWPVRFSTEHKTDFNGQSNVFRILSSRYKRRKTVDRPDSAWSLFSATLRVRGKCSMGCAVFANTNVFSLFETLTRVLNYYSTEIIDMFYN